jgi:N-formylglutamate amidohydrolase
MNCMVKRPYTNIVLAIPHSSGRSPGETDANWEGNPKIVHERDRFTDWFTDELFASSRDGISVVTESLSRFDCDVERLEGEVDRICKHTLLGGPEVSAACRNKMLSAWFDYRARLMAAAAWGERPLIIDCHSFPSDLSLDVDVCLGFNEDESRPPDDILATVASFFEQTAYVVAFNRPYANAIAPVGYVGHSIMIEVSKRCYMDRDERLKGPSFDRLRATIRQVYQSLLG